MALWFEYTKFLKNCYVFVKRCGWVRPLVLSLKLTIFSLSLYISRPLGCLWIIVNLVRSSIKFWLKECINDQIT